MLLCTPGQLAASGGEGPIADCPSQRTSERVRVVHVYDGDTLKLHDGRRLRLIGINAPEIGRDGTPTQALAEPARSALEKLLEKHRWRLGLRPGKASHDHYGRLLAHAYLGDGSNVAVHLLGKGLATALVVPPNTWAQECYQARENSARAARRGLWSLPEYQPLESRHLPLETRGFRLVRGRIKEIRQSRDSVWLQLEGPLVIRVARRDLGHFGAGFPEKLAGQRIEARGWIRRDDRGLRLNLRHPAAITRIQHRQR